jgi:Raf kinase inhibitor-like YbhB/YbcL family protein
MRTFAFVTGLVACGLGYAGAASALTLTSTDIKPGGRIASEQAANLFGCTSPNVSPALAWSGAPKATKSFAISMYDPDAPTGSGFWHWWVVDIPPDVTSLPKGAGSGAGLPAGAMQGRNDYSTTSYGGPCPPPGKPHRYIITIYALGVDKLDVDQNVSPAVIGFNANAHTLAKATLTSLYGR